ncbi:MAG: hypothetical protein K2X38_02105 [Gemmataceae bacterium]|nr:hypothetical protein [Gemmataceae bacterium]
MSHILDLDKAINEIIASNERIQTFWTKEASGWSPRETAELLESSRMDRLVSLSRSLRLWAEPCAEEDREGRLILAWANLGILVEGTMTWFLCVFESDYAKQPMKAKAGFDLRPNRLRFEEMCRFFSEHVWIDSQRAEWDDWLANVRNFRNAVHAFNHRHIGDWNDWQDAVVRYHDFIGELDGRVPYPEARDYYA